MGPAARLLGDGGCPWITGHNRTKTGHGCNLALNSWWSGSAVLASPLPSRGLWLRLAKMRRVSHHFPADRGSAPRDKKARSGLPPGRGFGECSFLKDSRYASQVISEAFRRGGKATGAGNPPRDARPRIDRKRFRP